MSELTSDRTIERPPQRSKSWSLYPSPVVGYLGGVSLSSGWMGIIQITFDHPAMLPETYPKTNQCTLSIIFHSYMCLLACIEKKMQRIMTEIQWWVFGLCC